MDARYRVLLANVGHCRISLHLNRVGFSCFLAGAQVSGGLPRRKPSEITYGGPFRAPARDGLFRPHRYTAFTGSCDCESSGRQKL